MLGRHRGCARGHSAQLMRETGSERGPFWIALASRQDFTQVMPSQTQVTLPQSPTQAPPPMGIVASTGSGHVGGHAGGGGGQAMSGGQRHAAQPSWANGLQSGEQAPGLISWHKVTPLRQFAIMGHPAAGCVAGCGSSKHFAILTQPVADCAAGCGSSKHAPPCSLGSHCNKTRVSAAQFEQSRAAAIYAGKRMRVGASTSPKRLRR